MIPGVIAAQAMGLQWSPAAEASLASWLVADNPSNVIDDGNLAVLADKSGNSRTGVATGGQASNYAVLTPSNLNARTTWKRQSPSPTGSFNLSDLTFSNGLGGLTMAVVHRLASSIGTADVNVLRVNAGTGFVARSMIGRGSYGSNYVYAGGRRLDTDAFVSINNGADVGTDWLIIVADFDYAAGKLTLSINGTVYSNASAFTPGSISATNSIGIGIGQRGDGPSSASALGDYAELTLFASALSDASRQKLEGYLAWQWGLQDSLPEGHPYKSVRP